MDRTYLTTAGVARIVGVHPNTVRLYEQWGFLPPIPRDPRNGYRRFTPQHLAQMRLARTALQWPYPSGKVPVLDLVYKAAASYWPSTTCRAAITPTPCRPQTAQPWSPPWTAGGFI